ncbi:MULTISPECIES: acyl carrier protein [unclassified Micromonospora]|jgi:acyl carrier protein|uniref:acyl carrier protein n=1 Tax=unclassified Micromonospora TaxID=2617518 RepID=UPI001034235C|nr:MULTISPECIES: acyl carrier protein [unclassified Micromonospora]QKW13663.1 acyl carrier protein [Verrucosispora sp. NA02020]TBL45552.1 acyl carrier protein [Verrucosispora sp. SN26_14.1]
MTELSPSAAPTDTERRLVTEVVEPLLGFTPDEMSQDLIALGADSMQLVHMLAQAEDLFDVELSAVELMDNVSVAGLAALIDRQRATGG